jgi:uroporphyrinogen III methyltransferase/synthase
VRWGTRPDQETIAGTLATLPALIRERHLKPPATIIVGEVVGLQAKLNWYERLPLFGRNVVVTRARDQAYALSSRLHSLGANAIELPAIEILPAADPAPLDRAIARLREYDWLIFTSVNGVAFFLERLDASSSDLRSLRAKLCVIGPATRAALEHFHLKVDLMGEEYVAESLLAAFAPFDLTGQRVLLARAAVARDLLPAGLAARGAHVDVVEAYRTVAPENLARRAAEIFDALRPGDWITFTSSSTVKNLMQVVDPARLTGLRVATIGPVTTETARALGLAVDAEASPYTIDGLVDGLVDAPARMA